MKLRYAAALCLPFVTACNMTPMTTSDINQLYSNTTSLSADKSYANYYAASGKYTSTNLKTGEAKSGTWSAKDPDQICIQNPNEVCFKMAKTEDAVQFTAPNGKTSKRKLDEYLSGNQTQVLLNYK